MTLSHKFLCSLIATVLAASSAAGGEGRSELEQALLAARMQHLGLFLAREAYRSHAESFQQLERPELRDTAIFYQALVEAACQGKLPKDVTADRSALEPCLELSVEDPEDASKRIEYRFYDPGLFADNLANAVTRLEIASRGDDAEAAILAIWCHALMDRPAQALDRAVQLRDGPLWEGLDTLARGEVGCLAAATALRHEDQEAYESWTGLITDQASVGLWGLRALSLWPQNGEWNLRVAQRSIRSEIAPHAPFAAQLMAPRRKSDRERTKRLLDIYWETAWLWRTVEIERSGAQIPTMPHQSAVNAWSLMTELSSPMRRQTVTALHVVMLAEVGALNRNLDRWQVELRDEMVKKDEIFEVLRYLARVLSGRMLTTEQEDLFDADDENFAESLELLLVGGDAHLPSAPWTVAQGTAVDGQRESGGVHGRSWLLWLGGVAVSVVLVAAIVVYLGRRR